jgi:competence protein ComEC
VRICFAFIAGIYGYSIFPSDHFCYPFILLALFIIIERILIIRKKHDDAGYLYGGIVTLLVFFSLGYIRTQYTHPMRNPLHNGHFAEKCDSLKGVVKDKPTIKNTIKIELAVKQMWYAGKSIKAQNSIIVYFSKQDTNAFLYKAGDEIMIKNESLKPILSNTNPESFDYKEFLERKDITHQIFVWKSNNHYKKDSLQLNPLLQFALLSRDKCINIIHKYVPDSTNAGVASALLVGYRQGISTDLYKSFIDTGSVHILAVSGMHLSLIAGGLFLLMRRMGNDSTTSTIVKNGTVLSILWYFTLITGASESVVRSAIMITMVLLGRSVARKHSIYNILALSALIMLCVEPNLIYQIGFQFSYLALLSLAYFQPHISKIFASSYTTLQYIWECIAASIASQIIMAPIVIFHFNKFPLYFILTGVVSVILSILALYLGLIMIVLESFLPIVNSLLAPLFNVLIKLFVSSVLWVKKLPGFNVEGLTLSGFELVMVGGIVLSLMMYLYEKSFIYIKYMAILFVVLLLSVFARASLSQSQMKVTAYDVNKNGLIDIFYHRNLYSINFDSISAETEEFTCKRYRYLHLMRPPVFLNLDQKFERGALSQQGNLLIFDNKKMAVLYKEDLECQDLSTYDYIFLMNKSEFKDCVKFSKKATVIVDRSISKAEKSLWKDKASMIGAKYYDIQEQGAKIINFNN